jgi:hypothetical protein
MQLKELSLTNPKISPFEILQALAIAIPSETIEAAIESTQSQRVRQRRLPTYLIVALIIAMSLWSKDSIEDVRSEFSAWSKCPMDSFKSTMEKSK